MGEWKRIKLSEVLKEKTERNKNNETDLVLSVTNSQGFVKQSDFFEGTVHSEDISNYKLVKKNEFAYNPSRINVGSIDILKEYDIGALSPMYVIFSVDETKLLPDYFKHYFQTHKFNENVKNNTQGSVRNSLSFKALSEFEYLLPPLEEQKRIVKILDQVNRIIEKYQNLISEKEQFIKSQFVEMFGGIGHYEKIGDICSIKARIGWQGLTKKEYLESGDYYLVTGTDFNGNTIDFNNCSFVTQERYNQDENIQLKEKDVLVTKDGTIGKVAFIDKLPKPATLNSGVFVVRDKLNILNPIYLEYALLSNDFSRFIRKIKTGSTIAHLNQEVFLKFRIPIPEKKLQDKFEPIVQLIDKQKFELEKQKQNYIDLKKGLMQQLLTGRLKVS